MDFIDTLNKLKILNLAANKISVIEGIRNCKKLEIVNLSHNRLTSIQPLTVVSSIIDMN